MEGALEWHILFHVGVVFPGEGCSFGRILQAPGPGQAPDGVRWAKVVVLLGKEAGGPHLSPPPGEGTALLLPAVSICWGGRETAGWWGQDQICNLSVLLSCSEGAPCAEGGGVHRMGDTLGRTPGHWDLGKEPIAGIQEDRQSLLGGRWVCKGSGAAGDWTPGD